MKLLAFSDAIYGVPTLFISGYCKTKKPLFRTTPTATMPLPEAARYELNIIYFLITLTTFLGNEITLLRAHY